MKELLTCYAAYTAWANDRIRETLLSLSDSQQQQEISSSFTSIYKTAFHVWGATYLWLKRVQHEPHIIKLDDPFNGSMEKLCEAWKLVDRDYAEIVKSMGEEALIQKLKYQNFRGDPFEEELYLILQHIFNHATYHRGQLVTLLRQVGQEKIPSTDFIAWVRSRGINA
jgi:uncharacterized damage-inducible protein DinB